MENVTGLYTHGNTPDNRVFWIEFDVFDSTSTLYMPASGSTLYVNYDNTVPIEVFGGDTIIGEFEYPVTDANYGNSEGALTKEVVPGAADTLTLDRPFPYPGMVLEPNYYVTNNTVGLNKLQKGQGIWFNYGTLGLTKGWVRQMIVSGIVESTIHTGLDYGDTFPHRNYIVRPYLWHDASDCTANVPKFDTVNNLYTQYLGTDYPGECSNWGYGGFRMFPEYNIDYSQLPVNTLHYSKPLAGFTDETSFCTRAIWSEQRPVNDVNAPGIQTFPTLNVFDLGDETGCINFAWSSTTGRDAGNIYVFTQIGIARMLTENSLLTEESGGALAAMGVTDSTVIQKAIWISKNIGMYDQTWRTAAEWNNTLYWMNENSAYKFNGSEITQENDIGNRKYKTVIESVIDNMLPGYGTDITSYYDPLNDEYWLSSCPHIKKVGYLYVQNNPSVLIPAPTGMTWTNGNPVNNGDIISIVGDQIDAIVITAVTVQSFYLINNNPTLQLIVVCTAGTPVLQLVNPGQCFLFTYQSPGYIAELVSCPGSCTMPIYSEKTGGSWIGTFGYRFDRYTAVQNVSYGVRNIQTWKLNEGPIMNGTNLSSWAMGVCSGVPTGRSQGKSEGQMNIAESKEFIRLRVSTQGTANAGVGTSLGIPKQVNFYDSIDQFSALEVQAIMNIAFGGPYYMRDYGGGWEQNIPRRLGTASFQPTLRMQGKSILFQIINDTSLNTYWRINSSECQFRNLV